jgi:hypothetical protein
MLWEKLWPSTQDKHIEEPQAKSHKNEPQAKSQKNQHVKHTEKAQAKSHKSQTHESKWVRLENHIVNPVMSN